MTTNKDKAGEDRIDNGESDDVEFEEPQLFDISLNWIGVTSKPDELQSVMDAVIEEGVHRGLFYESGYMQLKNETHVSVRLGSKLYEVLTGKGEK